MQMQSQVEANLLPNMYKNSDKSNEAADEF